MSFQSFFFHLGKIAENLGINICRPKDFQTAKCLVKGLADATECTSGEKDSVVEAAVTLANGETYSYTATFREFYVFTSVESANENQAISVNGANNGFLLDGGTRVFELCIGDEITVTDPDTGAGASWNAIIIPVFG